MEIIEKIGIGVIAAVIAGLVMYSFRIRQLYLLVPKMFGYSALTEKGKIIEIRVFNRGRAMEEEVYIDMPTALTYELIAADHPDVRLDKNKLIFTRISPKSEVSMVLLVEGAIENESFSPSLSSKTTKGKVVKKLEEVPQNRGDSVLVIVITILFLSALFFLPVKWFDYHRKQKEEKIIKAYSFLKDDGWREYERALSSEVLAGYSGFEFPILFRSAKRKGNYIEVQFLAINKTAAPLQVTAFFENEEKDIIIHDIFQKVVEPMKSMPVVISDDIPKGDASKKFFVRVTLGFGKNNLIGLKFYPSLNKAANRVLQ
jgi:hypothetical protein